MKLHIWAGYVFRKDYKLNSWKYVEKHIEEKDIYRISLLLKNDGK